MRLAFYLTLTVFFGFLHQELILNTLYFKLWIGFILIKFIFETDKILDFAKNTPYFSMLSKGFKVLSLLALFYMAQLSKSFFISTQDYALAKKSNRIAWIYDEQEALKKSKDLNRPLFIEFYADWCMPCKQMEVNTFSEPEIQNLIMEHYIPFRVDATQSTPDVNRVLAKYRVNAFPSVLFYDVNRSKKNKLTGYLDAYRLSLALKKYKN